MNPHEMPVGSAAWVVPPGEVPESGPITLAADATSSHLNDQVHTLRVARKADGWHPDRSDHDVNAAARRAANPPAQATATTPTPATTADHPPESPHPGA